MDVSSFFLRLVQPAKTGNVARSPDDLGGFDAAWNAIRETLEHPDERQLVRGITSTEVPKHLQHIVDALVYESNRVDEDETGACLEYFLKHDLLANLERLCEADRPHGIKGEVLRAINTLVVLLTDRFLIHNAVHRPLRRLLRSCVGDEPEPTGDGRVFGAAGMDRGRRLEEDMLGLEADLVDLMCILCSKMRAYPPLLLIFLHDKGWLQPHPPTSSHNIPPALSRALSPTPSALTSFSDPSLRPSSTGQTGRFEFLLFSYLLRFVHREGRVGDFARAGLLFLFDIAFLTPSDEGGENLSMSGLGGMDPLQDARNALAEFMLDGDFAEVMAAAIGAVYSLLPSKLRIPNKGQHLTEEEQSAPPGTPSAVGTGIVGHYPAQTDTGDEEIALSSSPDVRGQLDLLLKLFGFIQDIITRCASPLKPDRENNEDLFSTQAIGAAISDSTLEAIETSFFENILYPSILECSSSDGSSVAVVTYLDVILGNLDDGPLLSRLLHFVLDTETSDAPRLAAHHQPKRRTRITGAKTNDRSHSDYTLIGGKFTLKDLVLDSLRSNRGESRAAALRLLQTIFDEHCLSAADGVISPSSEAPRDRSLPRSTISTESRIDERELYGALTAQLDPTASRFDTSPSLSAYVADITVALQSDGCFLLDQIDAAFLTDDEKKHASRLRKALRGEHHIGRHDAVMRELLDALSDFLGRTAEENVALSGAALALASCSQRRLGGWLVYDLEPSDPWEGHRGGDAFDSSRASHVVSDNQPAIYTARQDVFANGKPLDLPAMYVILRELVKQVTSIRETTPNFDRYLRERRRELLFDENLDEGLSAAMETDAFGTPGGESVTPVTPVMKRARPSLAGSIKGFFSPKWKGPSTPTGGSPSAKGVDAGASGRPLVQRAGSSSITTVESMSSRIRLDPISPIPSGPWAPLSASSSPGVDAGMQETPSADHGNDRSHEVTLSQVLDNCIVLEEFIKEIIALIIVRRALGVDQVDYI